MTICRAQGARGLSVHAWGLLSPLRVIHGPESILWREGGLLG